MSTSLHSQSKGAVTFREPWSWIWAPFVTHDIGKQVKISAISVADLFIEQIPQSTNSTLYTINEFNMITAQEILCTQAVHYLVIDGQWLICSPRHSNIRTIWTRAISRDASFNCSIIEQQVNHDYYNHDSPWSHHGFPPPSPLFPMERKKEGSNKELSSWSCYKLFEAETIPYTRSVKFTVWT